MNRLAKQIASLVLLLLFTCTAIAQAPVEVEIQSLDIRNKSLSVTHNGKTLKLAIAPNVAITVEGNKSDLSAILSGDTASLIYDKDIAAVTSIAAQRAVIVPAEKLAEGWDMMDDRLIFLMLRLASTEASLEAVENAIAVSNRSSSRKTVQSKQAEKKNDDMDRNGGGPVKWSSFYGRTAESFFYHPTDRNTTYHTTTILSQQAPAYDNQAAAGVPSRQGLPVHQRPPQFDYLYRANESAKARAENEVSKLVGKTAELTERRQRLEAEQAGLWCEIAFRAISHYDLDKKPLHRFEPIIPLDTASRESAESMKAATCFMALALSIIQEAERDQATTFSKIKPAIAQARQNLNDTWLRQAVDVTDRQSNEGRFAALTKRLDDVASNLSDSYVVAVEGDQANDQSRKDTFRGTLQVSLINYAQVILALDEMTSQMKDQWKIKPDVDRPIQFVGLGQIPSTTPTMRATSRMKLGNNAGLDEAIDQAEATSLEQNENLIGSTLFRGHRYKVFREAGLDWMTAKSRCAAMGGHLVTISDEQENKFMIALATKTIGDINNSGIWLGATDERNEGQWEWIDGTPFKYTSWGNGQPNGKEKENHLVLLLYFLNNQGQVYRDWRDHPMAGKIHVIYYACEWDSVGYNSKAPSRVNLGNDNGLGGVSDSQSVESMPVTNDKQVKIPVGEFAVHWTEQSGKSGDSTYVFQVDGTVLKGKSPYGKANSMNGKVTIQYFDKTRGSVSITDLTDDSFKAIHTWQDGQNTTWKASRVK